MSYLRHRHGNGKKYDEAEASKDSYISKTSIVSGISDIQNAVIENSVIKDAFIYEAQIINSRVEASLIAGKVRVENSTVICDKITGRARVIDSGIFGESRISESARVENCLIKNLNVSGNAVIRNWENEIFEGFFGRIHSGVWERPPRIVRFEDMETTITEGADSFVFVGCLSKPIKTWLKNGNRYGKARGWTPEQIQRLRKLLELWLDNPIEL